MGIGVKDFNRSCRCCLAMVNQMQPLFGASLNIMLVKLMNLQVTPTDGYPQQMCTRCVLKLSSAYTFYVEVVKNQKTLEDILKAGEENGEPIIGNCGEQQSAIKPDIVNQEINTCNKPSTQDLPACKKATPNKRISRINILRKVKNRSESESSSSENEGYKCSQCKHSSRSEEDLKKHLQTHVAAESRVKVQDVHAHLCDICGARYRLRTSLHKHARRHGAGAGAGAGARGGGGARCPHPRCRNTFGETAALRLHLLSHSSDPKPFHCTVCPRTFTQPSSRNRHMKRHTARAQLACSCGKRFLHKYSLKRHRESVHSVSECAICKKVFTGKKLLHAHMKCHKKDELEKQTDNTSITVPIHVQTLKVEFLCLICKTTFQTSESLEVHICGEKIT